jgi:hypothetical protein
MENLRKILIYLTPMFFLFVYSFYYARKEKKLNLINELDLKPHKGETSFLVFIEFFAFILGLTLIIFPSIALIGILLKEWEKATLFAIFLLSFLIISGLSMISCFVVILQHLIFLKGQKIEYLRKHKTLVINRKRFNFNEEDFTIKIYKPKKWILKPIIYNRAYKKFNNHNRIIEFRRNEQSVKVSKIIFLPEDLIKLVENYHRTETIERNFNWIK